MTEPSEAAIAKTDELFGGSHHVRISFARFIQEVNDAAKLARDYIASRDGKIHAEFLDPFILSEPVDRLEMILVGSEALIDTKTRAAWFRAELAKHGLKIVEDKS